MFCLLQTLQEDCVLSKDLHNDDLHNDDSVHTVWSWIIFNRQSMLVESS